MPVVVDRGRHGRQIVAGRNGHEVSAVAAGDNGTDCIEIGIINNMPDSALEATEQQFLTLLASAAERRWLRVRFFSLPGVARSQRARELIASYSDIGELWQAGLSGLIVTGTEPIARNLMDEPYWPAFAKVVDWAAHSTVSAIWSCLATHAAVLHLDGIARIPFAEKCFGVFDCETIADRPLTVGLPPVLRIPHARHNGLPEDALVAKGYQVITRSREAGVDMFVRNGQSLFLFLQGHPEYGAHSLLNEYRRDIGRFLRGERDKYPTMPRHYFNREMADAMAGFQREACMVRSESLLERFPAMHADQQLVNTWHASAVQIYRNWLSHLADRTYPRAGRTFVAGAESDALVL